MKRDFKENDLRRVVITGLGAVTPIGHGKQGLWEGILAGRSAVCRITRFDASSFRSQIAAEIPDFNPANYLEAKEAKRFDRYSQLAVASAQQAWQDSCLSNSRVDKERIGVSVGSALGGIKMAEEQCSVLGRLVIARV